MKHTKLVAWGIIASLGLAILTGAMEPINEDSWYMLSGLGMFVFGIWAIVILFKIKSE